MTKAGVPVRGTQSFVDTMAEVFKRPSLTGLELLWRWVFWAALLVAPARWLSASGAEVIFSFQATGFPGLLRAAGDILGQVYHFVSGGAAWPWLAGIPIWWALGALGRVAVLRRMDGQLRPRWLPLFTLGALRWTAWALALGLWCALFALASRTFVLTPQAVREDASWVPFFAAMIAGTLLLFVLWLGTSWVLTLAVLYSAQGLTVLTALRRCARRGPLAGKLMEINLVLGIVKIALLVLALVFSACPLPFETVETQGFLLTWTGAVVLLYVAASDYFHAVRLLAFLRMADVFAPLPLGAAAPQGRSAS